MAHTHARRTPILAVACAAALGLAPAAILAGGDPVYTQTIPASLSDYADYTEQLIVKLRPEADGSRTGITAERLRELSVAAGIDLSHVRAMSGKAEVLGLPARLHLADAEVIARRLSRHPLVEYAEPDRWKFPMAVPTDPDYGKQWHYMSPNPATDNEPGGANLPGAWDITTGDPSVIAAIIDTGISEHEDHDPNRLVPGYDMVSSVRFGNDGDARDPDPSDPGDWCLIYPSSWHGTHVAGTIGAATNNGLGGAGITWNARLMHVRGLGKCGGTTSDIVDAMRWAAGLPVPDAPANPNQALALNLSLGGNGDCSQAEQDAIDDVRAVGTTVVVAAGNENHEASRSSPGNCNGVITVAAVNRAGGRASYSNFGPEVEIAAPGGDSPVNPDGVYSTINSGKKEPEAPAYAYYAGTSMATPHITGIVALIQSAHLAATGNLLTPDDVLNIIQDTARPFPAGTLDDCTPLTCGAGIVDAAAAVARATTPPNPEAPHADAGQDQAVDPGASVSLDGSNSTNGGPITYAWTQTAGTPVTLNGANTATPSFTAPLPTGTLSFELSVTDNQALTDSDTVNVVVRNLPPVLDPIGNKQVKRRTPLSFTVSATDPNGTQPILTATGLPKGASFDSATGVFNWPKPKPRGIYYVTFTATDAQSPTLSVSEIVAIEVTRR